MTCEEQLNLWVQGNPVHNRDRDECCPDFSCCQPELLAESEVRQRFKDADEATRFSMLGMFLGAAMADMGADVHIADGTDLEVH